MPAVRSTHRNRASSPRGGPAARGERGAILVQTAVMMIGLTAFSAFIVDYGILWTARRQVQNAADAAALAAAISLGFDVPFDAPGGVARARLNAHTAVEQNPVWGAAANVDDPEITFPACPAGSVAAPSTVCVRVDAYRNQEGNNPLPTIFGRLVGVDEQGVKATATAQVLFGSSTDCVRPIAIPDRWQEVPPPWTVLSTFGPSDGYQPPSGPGQNGTGYSRSGPEYGALMRFAPDPVFGLAGNEYFLPVDVSGGFASDLGSCSSRVVSPGDELHLEYNVASVTAATPAGIRAFIDADLAAAWNPAMNGGLGGVSGGCMSSGGCTVSPRIIALPFFDPRSWEPGGGDVHVIVSRIAGFFIEAYDPPYIVGRLMVYPAAPRSTMTADPQSAFVVSVALVR